MTNSPNLPPEKLIKMHDRMFLETVRAAILDKLNEETRANYAVEGWVQLPDGDWVIQLKRTLDSYDTD